MVDSEADKLMSKAEKLTKLSFTRWTADWKGATTLYEQAAIKYRMNRETEKAKLAYEMASKGQEMISSPWDAAKHMETAATLAKELGKLNEVVVLYRKASELYNECGRAQPASDALSKGARAIEDATPDEALLLYKDACSILEEDGKEHMVFDLYRDATSVLIKLQKYLDAAELLLKWGLAADHCNAVNSQCKAYLSAIIVYLYAHDLGQAEKCYGDCSQIDAFANSDQGRCASKLLVAYHEKNVEEIRRVAQSSNVSNLDHVIVRLARKLPTQELTILSTQRDEEALDENDLT